MSNIILLKTKCIHNNTNEKLNYNINRCVLNAYVTYSLDSFFCLMIFFYMTDLVPVHIVSFSYEYNNVRNLQ